MKVLLFANTDWYLFNFRAALANSLVAAGHDVVLVSPRGKYSPFFAELGLRWLEVPLQRRSLNPFAELRFLLRLRDLIASERPDVLHSFTIKPAIYGSIVARWLRLPARVNAIAGLGYTFTSNDLRAKLLRPLVRLLFRFALGDSKSALVVQNRDDLELFSQQGFVDPRRIYLIRGSGVNCTRFSLGSAPRSGRRVLFAGRLLRDKGLVEYVDAARLVAQNTDAVFLVAGEPDDGNPAAVSRLEFRSWCEKGAVEWLGHVDDMPALLRSVDVFVLPSYREGLPKGLIEAAASGLALVATDVPGCRDVIDSEVNGILVPPRDSKALAAAISRLLKDPPLAQRLGLAAREKALREFEERRVVQATIDVYDRLLASA